MDKKTGIIIGVICAIIVVLLCVVFVKDSKIEDIPSNVLVTINGERHTAEEYKKYESLKNFEAGETNKEMTEEEISNMVTEFVKQKIFYLAAKEKGVSGEAETDYQAEYAKNSAELSALGISQEEYKNMKEEEELVNQLKYSFGDYYQLPEDFYNTYVESFKEEGLYNTYSFRIMNIPFEEPASGDEAESGEETSISGEAPAEASESGEEKKDMSKEAQEIIAKEVVEKIRAGEDFAELSKEYGQMRIAFAGKGYTIVNGDIEYATGPVLKSKLGGTDEVYNAFLALEVGECTDAIEIPSYNIFQIVKLESKDEGFVGEGETELKDLMLDEIQEELVAEGVKVDYNEEGYFHITH